MFTSQSILSDLHFYTKKQFWKKLQYIFLLKPDCVLKLNDASLMLQRKEYHFILKCYARITLRINKYMCRYTPASGRSEANLIIIGKYVRLFTINRFTSGDVIHFIYKIFCLTRKCLLFQYKTLQKAIPQQFNLRTKQHFVKHMHYNSVVFILSRVSGSSNRKRDFVCFPTRHFQCL